MYLVLLAVTSSPVFLLATTDLDHVSYSYGFVQYRAFLGYVMVCQLQKQGSVPRSNLARGDDITREMRFLIAVFNVAFSISYHAVSKVINYTVHGKRLL
jgi:hypothetical protein